MTYMQFVKQLAAEQGISKREAETLLAERAQAVAKLANVHFGGINNRGVLFVTSWLDNNVINAPTCFFNFETIIEEPSQVIDWSRSIRDDSWPSILNQPSSAWFGA